MWMAPFRVVAPRCTGRPPAFRFSYLCTFPGRLIVSGPLFIYDLSQGISRNLQALLNDFKVASQIGLAGAACRMTGVFPQPARSVSHTTEDANDILHILKLLPGHIIPSLLPVCAR